MQKFIAFQPASEVFSAVMPGAGLLGLPSRNFEQLETALAQGLQESHLQKLQQSTSLPQKAIAALAGISYETLNQYRQKNKALQNAPSMRLYEFARVFERAIEVIGNQQQANAWLNEPVLALAGNTPLETMKTALGTERVMQILERLDDGAYS